MGVARSSTARDRSRPGTSWAWAVGSADSRNAAASAVPRKAFIGCAGARILFQVSVQIGPDSLDVSMPFAPNPPLAPTTPKSRPFCGFSAFGGLLGGTSLTSTEPTESTEIGLVPSGKGGSGPDLDRRHDAPQQGD